MLVEFELDGEAKQVLRRAINPECVIMVEERLPNGKWGGAVTNIHLASQPGGPQMVSVRGAYDETVRMLKAGHVSARAVAT